MAISDVSLDGKWISEDSLKEFHFKKDKYQFFDEGVGHFKGVYSRHHDEYNNIEDLIFSSAPNSVKLIQVFNDTEISIEFTYGAKIIFTKY